MSMALELAKRLTDLGPIDFDDVAGPAAAELRRLSAVEAELIALKKAISEAEPVAWHYTLDNTEGCRRNKPWEVISSHKRNPFGKPGIDYSETYPVTSVPLYTLKGIK